LKFGSMLASAYENASRTMAGFHRLEILLPRARGPFEIGEKKGHRARR